MSNTFRGPVTSDIENLFLCYGVDPYRHQALVTGLMEYVYDNMIDTVKDTQKHVTNTIEDAMI
jgi:hypothetical protein